MENKFNKIVTAETVASVLAMKKEGLRNSFIAGKFDLSTTTIGLIVTGKHQNHRMTNNGTIICCEADCELEVSGKSSRCQLHKRKHALKMRQARRVREAEAAPMPEPEPHYTERVSKQPRIMTDAEQILINLACARSQIFVPLSHHGSARWLFA